MKITVLGPGCANCINLENRTKEAINDLKIEATIEKITDYAEIIATGLRRTPGLQIDGNIAVQGKVPSVEELKEIFKKFTIEN